MTIETKYKKGDTVWVMGNNKPSFFKIGSIEILSGDNIVGLKDPYITYRPSLLEVGGNRLQFHEDDLFPTKESLLQSL